MGADGEAWVALWSALGVFVVATAVLAVALVRAKRSHRAVIERHGWIVERERAIVAATAVQAERARIAAELHDIVGHNVSVIVIQAGVARDALDRDPAEVRSTLDNVEQAGRDALAELRTLLSLLRTARDGEEESGLSPQPGLGGLSTLVDKVAFAGLPVEVRVSGEPRPLPAGIDLTAYRIVQEALTNALKYGGEGIRAEVAIRYAGRYLRIEVTNTGPSVLSGSPSPPPAPARQPSGAGRGLLGLRERVAVYGGELDARQRLGGGYRVRAKIPLDSSADDG